MLLLKFLCILRVAKYTYGEHGYHTMRKHAVTERCGRVRGVPNYRVLTWKILPVVWKSGRPYHTNEHFFKLKWDLRNRKQ